MNSTDLLAQIAEHIKRVEAERDAAIARAERAEHEVGELCDDVAELQANLKTSNDVLADLIAKYEGEAA